MVNISETIARNEQRVERLLQSQPVLAARARRLKRRWDAFIRRLTRMVGGAAAVAIAAFIWGVFVSPIGISGVLLTLLAMISVFFLLAFFPRAKDPVVASLPDAPLAALPAQVEDWLDSQRKALPSPSRAAIDRIMVQVDELAPELAVLKSGDSRADDARRLLSDHLPRLVKSYTDVPERLRGKAETEAQFAHGLNVVEEELGRLARNLGKDRLDALEVEGRFLESRYRPKE